MKSATPIVKDLVLIGGGHSHAIALKMLGMNPIPGVRLTLITDVYHTPYSGMLPGFVAGLYTFDECHIDLRPLAQFAQARMIPDRALGLDLQTQRVICENHPPIGFDVLSIDIGSTPATLDIPGAQDFTIPVKPISQFLTYWEHLVETIRQAPEKPMRIGVVGGGAGGVELTLSIQAHLQRIYQHAGQPASNLELHLFQRGPELLPERHPSVRQKFQRIFAQRRIQLHLRETVVAIAADPGPDAVRHVTCQSGRVVPCDRVFWVTQASAAPWIAESGLAVTERGFIQVNNFLQSVSHGRVFAAGDVATLVEHPRPKAGVFAVRQGKPLYDNLCRAVLEQPLKPFIPQKQFLILIGTGQGSAVASRGPFTLGPSPLIWRWKDHIDRKFMDRFTDLTPMSAPPQLPPQASLTAETISSRKAASPHPPTSQIPNAPAMPCAGCGSKIGHDILETVLVKIQQDQPMKGDRDDILIGLDAPDDAAAIQIPAGQALLQTLDYFPALINDPFVFAQICAHHCLSDLFAMGATPHSALAMATAPYAIARKQEETLYQLLSGAVNVLNSAGAPLIGGHTIAGEHLVFGLACNGLAAPSQLLRKGGMQPGDALILTKALGTGALFAADMQLKAKGRWIEGAIASMLISNQEAARSFQHHQAHACTDVTGFGLVGHLLEMLQASHRAAELWMEALPVLEGVLDISHQGIVSSLYAQNYQASTWIGNLDQARSHPQFPVLFDPQTSGGLLASIPGDRAESCLSALHQLGYPESRIVGRVYPRQPHQPPITLQG